MKESIEFCNLLQIIDAVISKPLQYQENRISIIELSYGAKKASAPIAGQTL